MPNDTRDTSGRVTCVPPNQLEQTLNVKPSANSPCAHVVSLKFRVTTKVNLRPSELQTNFTIIPFPPRRYALWLCRKPSSGFIVPKLFAINAHYFGGQRVRAVIVDKLSV